MNELTELLANAREQVAYWTAKVNDLEMRQIDQRCHAFVATHKVVVTTPPHTIPHKFRVDGEPMGESQFLDFCFERKMDPGTVYDLAVRQSKQW